MDTFTTKKAAFTWYAEQAGQLQYRQFTNKLPKGRSVSKLLVSEMLRIEQRGAQSDEGLSREKQRLEIQALQQKLAKGELDNRKEDARWLPKQDVTLQLAALCGLIYDTLRHYTQIEVAKICHAAGVEAGRSSELETAIESMILDQAFNEIAGQKLVDLEFVEGEK
jgi:hypothetical protein